jgi:hypothetical protein
MRLTTCASAAGTHAGAGTNLRSLAAPPESAARAEPRAPPACRLHARVRRLRASEQTAETSLHQQCSLRSLRWVIPRRMGLRVGPNLRGVLRLNRDVCWMLGASSRHQDKQKEWGMRSAHLDLHAGVEQRSLEHCRICGCVRLTTSKSAAGPRAGARTNLRFHCLASRNTAPARSAGPTRPVGCICGLGVSPARMMALP